MKFTTGDATYWYEVYGSGEPIVLLHGFTGSTQTWSNFITKWKSSLQIIAIDLPGHGRTNTPTPKTMIACCQDLNKLFHHLHLETFHLVGYSMGGRTALSFSMMYPDFIKSLILESASPGLAVRTEREKRREKDVELAQRIEQEGVTNFVSYWENIPLFSSQKKLSATIQQSIRNERVSQEKDGLASSLRYMGTGSQPSWWEELKSFRKPVLLVVGELDEKFQLINQRMEKHLQKSNLTVVKNAGHAIHVEQAEIFGKIVTEFIFQNSN
ncbi:2-succinyl-6-hydroxy-2,4-cyclohexadiene-1-carboxylate synthase [Ornithinibacillus salinisoli]|uniref:Putative 2-succinyl-6-hydroxy-2,4-cyclohexadiene-1-carboxylate synthase n=1 Tax=Ornithinibacillus salinisoli TaxID=1848459 RepID=A0ABW4VWU0_9BACI